MKFEFSLSRPGEDVEGFVNADVADGEMLALAYKQAFDQLIEQYEPTDMCLKVESGIYRESPEIHFDFSLGSSDEVFCSAFQRSLGLSDEQMTQITGLLGISSEYLVYAFNRNQLVNFLIGLWGGSWQECRKSDEALWQMIAKTEFSRTFQQGWDYCNSSLSFSPCDGRRWVYITTSGTMLNLAQSVWSYSDCSLIAFVSLPVSRKGGVHHTLLEYFKANPDAIAPVEGLWEEAQANWTGRADDNNLDYGEDDPE